MSPLGCLLLLTEVVVGRRENKALSGESDYCSSGSSSRDAVVAVDVAPELPLLLLYPNTCFHCTCPPCYASLSLNHHHLITQEKNLLLHF